MNGTRFNPVQTVILPTRACSDLFASHRSAGSTPSGGIACEGRLPSSWPQGRDAPPPHPNSAPAPCPRSPGTLWRGGPNGSLLYMSWARTDAAARSSLGSLGTAAAALFDICWALRENAWTREVERALARVVSVYCGRSGGGGAAWQPEHWD
ncbi:hypothetical protein OBBRIDRAFT_155893 [Obba rivulosa]|uniref:Uncharacterized protein n=1 Tax=Obba rivulosa TaxID=1052685 RepID=A0A8E2AMV8_9APHY|nr:hypothetical protein OBBRIDRAFT_155893 [Obba rivulosa]